MKNAAAIQAPTVPDDILSLIWEGKAAALPEAISTSRRRIQSELNDLDCQVAAIEQQREAMSFRLRFLDELEAGGFRSVAAAKTGQTSAPPQAPQPVKEDAKPVAASPSVTMTPAARRKRKEDVLTVARSVGREKGGEFSIGDLMDAIDATGVDLSVRGSHRATAVANIIIHSGDPDFALARRGIFSWKGASRGLIGRTHRVDQATGKPRMN